MKKTKLSLFQKYLFKYREWKSRRQMRILNKMVCFNIDSAIHLANQKRDILNHKVWVISGNGEFVIFARYQKMNLQLNKVLNKSLTSKDLDERASYIAYPMTEKDRSRKVLFRNFGNKKSANTKPADLKSSKV